MTHEDITEMIINHENQIQRIISDKESEKETRSRTNSELFAQIRELREQVRDLEKIYWKTVGSVSAVMMITQLIGFVLINWNKISK